MKMKGIISPTEHSQRVINYNDNKKDPINILIIKINKEILYQIKIKNNNWTFGGEVVWKKFNKKTHLGIFKL